MGELRYVTCLVCYQPVVAQNQVSLCPFVFTIVTVQPLFTFTQNLLTHLYAQTLLPYSNGLLGQGA